MEAPHTILFIDDLHSINVSDIGNKIEKLPIFPYKTNALFVKICNRNETMLKWWK